MRVARMNAAELPRARGAHTIVRWLADRDEKSSAVSVEIAV
jgi:hypothetical protein